MIILEFVMMNIHLFLIFNFLRVIEFVNIYPDIKGKWYDLNIPDK